MAKDDILARPEVGQLLHALTLIEDADEARCLLLDLCTIGEIGDLAQRLEVARLLDAGNSYVAVCEETGASSTTVSRVSKCLTGEHAGYRLILDRMSAADED